MEIRDSAASINLNDVRTSEFILNFSYPKEFIEFYINNNGGSPLYKIYIDDAGFETSVEWLFPIKYPGPIESIENVTIRFREKNFISNDEIIFAEDAGGNKFVMNKDYEILYVPFDVGPDFRNKTRLLEVGFQKFIDKLVTEEEAGF